MGFWLKMARGCLPAVMALSPLAAAPAGIEALRGEAAGLEGERREAAEFLIEHLPEMDRDTLPLEVFRENLEQAFIARETYPWAKALPPELFFNDVLPHAVVTETREAWRKRLRELIHPKVKDCASLKEVCAVVGPGLGKWTGVEYNTKREKACQSPAESMRQGMASCTGLAILMVDALRSVGVPARLVAVPLWGTKEGNHTWLEVHDGERWHSTDYGRGPDQWDQGWEIARCAYADPLEPIHGVFASSYKPTGVGFPMIWEWRREPVSSYCEQERDDQGRLVTLNWTLQGARVGGVDRTRHYLELAGGRKVPIPKGKACVAVRAFDREGGKRVAVPVRIRSGDGLIFEGRTATERQDLNDYVRVICAAGELTVEHQDGAGKWHPQSVTAPADKECAVRIEIGG
jgi:hypothetical protein